MAEVLRQGGGADAGLSAGPVGCRADPGFMAAIKGQLDFHRLCLYPPRMINSSGEQSSL